MLGTNVKATISESFPSELMMLGESRSRIDNFCQRMVFWNGVNQVTTGYQPILKYQIGMFILGFAREASSQNKADPQPDRIPGDHHSM